MTILTHIAWNNLLRNRRRTLSTIVAISVGVAMIVLTNALTNGISSNMSNSIIQQIDGHLRIEHRDYKKFFITDQEKILILDAPGLAEKIKTLPHVRDVMPRMMLGGLIGMGDKSSTFLGVAYDVRTLPQVLPDYGVHLQAGKLLDAADPAGIVLGKALADSLKIKLGDELVLLSKTVHGDQSNTLVHARGIVTFPTDYVVEQSLILTGLDTVIGDNLLDRGDSATQLIVRVDDTANVAQASAAIEQYLAERGLPWHVVPWYENAAFGRIVGAFNGIGGLIMFILVLMVGIITSNALLMTFFERMREIGSMRAIGMNQMQVSRLLYVESIMVAVLGAISGLLLGLILTAIANSIGIPLGLIGQNIYPVIQLKMILISTLVPIFFIVLAAYIPIREANKLSVVEALNYQ